MANRSPPGPQLMGSVTARTALAAMAASMALPPALRISMAACVASGWLVAAIPFLPTTVERVVKERLPGRSTASEDVAHAVMQVLMESAARMWFIMRISIWLDCRTGPSRSYYVDANGPTRSPALSGVFRGAEIVLFTFKNPR